MAQDNEKPTGPDLSAGVAAADLAEGAMLVGHLGGEDVLVARQGGHLFAVSAQCTHYHGPLAEGLMVGASCVWPYLSQYLELDQK